MKYSGIREEELKNRIAQEYFSIYDCAKIIGNVDFCVRLHQADKQLFEQESLLWAEAKTDLSDIYDSIAQLVITIGKARTFDKFMPPPLLGAMDGEKIAFVPYSEIHDIFYLNDFNWNVTPSDSSTKEFQLIRDKVKTIIDPKALLFNFESDEKDLRKFIKDNFIVGKLGFTKIKIDKNNFIVIYSKWLKSVKPSIAVNWELAKKKGVIDGDFYLADLLSSENVTLKEKLYVVLKSKHYELNRHQDEYGAYTSSSVEFNDKQVAHTQFWNRYERPPKEEYWDYIENRRDLLVPQDVRERKGSYFTPQKWVELSQKYLMEVLDEDWQDEYYIWDCAAGTGNLLHGLTNKYNIWASTLDTQDVEVMYDRIKNGANLLEEHVFQFDFLNDEFTKLPEPLQDIINNPEKRRKLVVYINPPYAEADSRKGEGRSGIAVSLIHKRYSDRMGYTKRELYIQFLTRIYLEINGCLLADFSKLKNLQAPKFIDFRNFFKAKLLKCFLVPAYTFDNVIGNFPIGFKIWDTSISEDFEHFLADVYDEDQRFIERKHLWAYDGVKVINDWTLTFIDESDKVESLGTIIGIGNDFQNQNTVRIEKPFRKWNHQYQWQITKDNLIETSIYLAVRQSVKATWINDRDQFLFPNDGWLIDQEFQNNCLTFTLFSHNNIQSADGINNWIPFTEHEVNSREKFESNFMTSFIHGKLNHKPKADLFGTKESRKDPLEFSPEAQNVFTAGKQLWTYYHAQTKCNVNATLYDIREYFQCRNDKGIMKSKSEDETYMELITNLRNKLKLLQMKIEPKVYEYGFLK
jgi:hypothetical protein